MNETFERNKDRKEGKGQYFYSSNERYEGIYLKPWISSSYNYSLTEQASGWTIYDTDQGVIFTRTGTCIMDNGISD